MGYFNNVCGMFVRGRKPQKAEYSWMTEELIKNNVFDQEVEAFDRKRHEIFGALVQELASASSDPEAAEFGRVFHHAQSVLGKTDLQMSLLFKVSRPTVGRWARSVTAPHPMLRKAVFDVLLGEAKQALKALRHRS
jgi:hypothetical protein